MSAQFEEKMIRFVEELMATENDQSVRDRLNTILEQEKDLQRIRILLSY
ncbi:hypothetical protein ES707_20325 [subsurface metagenome]